MWALDLPLVCVLLGFLSTTTSVDRIVVVGNSFFGKPQISIENKHWLRELVNQLTVVTSCHLMFATVVLYSWTVITFLNCLAQ